MADPCPRCGYPDLGGLQTDPYVGFSGAPYGAATCEPCQLVQEVELAKLQQVLPYARWAVND